MPAEGRGSGRPQSCPALPTSPLACPGSRWKAERLQPQCAREGGRAAETERRFGNGAASHLATKRGGRVLENSVSAFILTLSDLTDTLATELN